MSTALNPFLRRLRSALADPRLHEFLWFSIPGIAVALILRAALMISMPLGYYHPDSHDFLVTIYKLKTHFHFDIHEKTTFLTPILYTLAFFPKIPALFVIPLAQHARGLLLVLAVGALARLWFTHWKWLIVPLTILTALQPAMIFWEHTLMSESGFVFCAVMLALTGTFFVLRPDRLGYGLLLAGMFFVAAARPEGNLWQGSGILFVLLVYRGRWKQEGIKITGAVVMAAFLLSITKTSHSGLLLYASLVHLTPDHPRAAPGFGPYVQPLRDRMLALRREKVVNDVVRTGKRITEAMSAYVRDHPDAKHGFPINAKRQVEVKRDKNLSRVCRRLAIESALAHPWDLPSLAWRKFLTPINEDSGGTFQDFEFHAKQARSLTLKPELAQELGLGLAGVPLDTSEQITAFTDREYDLSKVTWFNAMEAKWQTAVNCWHLPDTRYSESFSVPGLPAYYLMAMIGALAALFRQGPTRRFHWAFVGVMFGAGFVVMLTAAVIPRHRFVWEPFWLLYGFLLIDSVIQGGVRLCGTRR